MTTETHFELAVKAFLVRHLGEWEKTADCFGAGLGLLIVLVFYV